MTETGCLPGEIRQPKLGKEDELSDLLSRHDGTGPEKWRNEKSERVEIFASEHEALKWARELLEQGEVHGVMVADDSGSVLVGFRLQLKLGFSPVE